MKARFNSKKRRGRPPLPVELREPNGRRSRNKGATAVFDLMNKQTGLSARMRVYGAEIGRCDVVEWGYLLGRLYLTTSYDMRSHQHEAGTRIAKDFALYFGLCGIPFPNARALDLFNEVRGQRMPIETDPEDRAKIKKKIELIENLLVPNSAISRIVKRVCVYEQDDGMWTGHNVALLKAGLELLAPFYGIPIEKDKKDVAKSEG